MRSLRITCSDRGKEHSIRSWVSFSVDPLTAYGTLGNFINFSGSHFPHLQREGFELDYLYSPLCSNICGTVSFQLTKKSPCSCIQYCERALHSPAFIPYGPGQLQWPNPCLMLSILSCVRKMRKYPIHIEKQMHLC